MIAITNGEFFGGSGCFVYYPHIEQFQFIPNTYHHYEEIKVALLQAGNDRDSLQEEGPSGDMLQLAYHLMAESLSMLNITTIEVGAEYFFKYLISCRSHSTVDKSLRFRYNYGVDAKEVEIIFSEDAGLEAMVGVLSVSD